MQRQAIARGLRIRVEGTAANDDEQLFTLVGPDHKPTFMRAVTLAVISAELVTRDLWSAPTSWQTLLRRARGAYER